MEQGVPGEYIATPVCVDTVLDVQNGVINIHMIFNRYIGEKVGEMRQETNKFYEMGQQEVTDGN
jgi:hypothetical protein